MKRLDNKGNAAIIMCLVITGILGFAAYVIDVGMIYAEKAKLTNAIDSAALASILELPSSDTKAITVAQDYLKKNNIDPNQTTIVVGADHKSIQIQAVKKVKHLFAPIIGINSSNVNAKTKAILAPAKSIKDGIRPFAVEAYDFPYGQLVTIKEGAGDGYHGNYGAVALGGQGANVFRSNALYGYDGTISVGDYINTEPGNIAGVTNEVQNYIDSENSTFDNFPRDSIRLWILPLVDSLDVNGQKSVLVVGFAAFYVEDVNNIAGKVEIQGRFVKYVFNSNTDVNLKDTGSYGARLSR